MVSCFLVVKALRGERFDTLGRMRSRVTNLNKCTQEDSAALKQIKVRRNDMKVLIKGVVAHARVQQAEANGLNKSLEESQSALEGMKEWVSRLMNDAVVDSVHIFEEARKWISLLYPHLNVSLLDPFKMVLDREFVDEK